MAAQGHSLFPPSQIQIIPAIFEFGKNNHQLFTGRFLNIYLTGKTSINTRHFPNNKMQTINLLIIIMGCCLFAGVKMTAYFLMIGPEKVGKSTILQKINFQRAQINTLKITNTTHPLVSELQIAEIKIDFAFEVYFRIYCFNSQYRGRIRQFANDQRIGFSKIIYVLDLSDTSRTATARNELKQIAMENYESVILVMANKKDLGGRSIVQLSQQLEMEKLKTLDWHIQPTCALTGEGIDQGLRWFNYAKKRNS